MMKDKSNVKDGMRWNESKKSGKNKSLATQLL